MTMRKLLIPMSRFLFPIVTVGIVLALGSLGLAQYGGVTGSPTSGDSQLSPRCIPGAEWEPTPSKEELLLAATDVFIGRVVKADTWSIANETSSPDIAASTYVVAVQDTVRGNAGSRVTVLDPPGLLALCGREQSVPLGVNDVALFVTVQSSVEWRKADYTILSYDRPARYILQDDAAVLAAYEHAHSVLFSNGSPVPNATISPFPPNSVPIIIDGTPTILFM
jgi:hypothetical protein